MGQTLTGQETAPPENLSQPEAVRMFLINQAVIGGQTERFLRLDRREAFLRALEYRHQQRDWNGNPADDFESIQQRATMPAGWEYSDPQADLPVRQKRPTAPTREARKIVGRFTGMLLSESRKPKITVEGDPETEDFLREVVKQSGFWRQMRAARNLGGGMGSVLVTVHVRDGRFAYEVHNPKHVTDIVWKDRATNEILGVLIMYSTIREEQTVDERGRATGVKQVEWLHRRIITFHEDITFLPARADQDRIDWIPDPNLTVTHALGFFPGVWIQNTEDVDDVDGDPDPEGAYEEIDTIDRVLAQANKSLLANLDPTLWLAYDAKKFPAERALLGQGPVRTGSNYTIDLPEGGTANLLQMNSDAIRGALDYVKFLRQSVHELCRVVMVDPEKISGAAQSAKAIEYLFEPMIERCDELRDTYGAAFAKLLDLTAQIARKFQDAKMPAQHPDTGETVMVPFELDLPPRVVRSLKSDGEAFTDTEPRRVGPGGSIALQWGPYFQATEQDDQARIANAASAKQSGLVTQRTASKHVAQVFGVEDADGEAAAAAQEAQADVERAMAGMDGGVRPEDLVEDPRERRGPRAAEGGRP